MTSVFFYEPFYDMDRLFDEAFSRGSPSTNARRTIENGGGDGAIRSLKPRMDLHENPSTNSVTATFELPGVKKEDVHIDVHAGRLTVSAETSVSADHEQSGYAVRERRYGKMARTLQLPAGVKDEDIKAGMENGVLTVTFPRSTPELAPKKITIA